MSKFQGNNFYFQKVLIKAWLTLVLALPLTSCKRKFSLLTHATQCTWNSSFWIFNQSWLIRWKSFIFSFANDCVIWINKPIWDWITWTLTFSKKDPHYDLDRQKVIVEDLDVVIATQANKCSIFTSLLTKETEKCIRVIQLTCTKERDCLYYKFSLPWNCSTFFILKNLHFFMNDEKPWKV